MGQPGANLLCVVIAQVALTARIESVFLSFAGQRIVVFRHLIDQGFNDPEKQNTTRQKNQEYRAQVHCIGIVREQPCATYNKAY